jgi:zinc transport system substrate-binding protein
MRRLFYLTLIKALVFIMPNYLWAAPEPLDIYVSLPPHAGFVKKLGGDHVKVHLLAQGGQDPHSFEPTPRNVLSLARADIFFTTGLPVEKQLVNKIRNRQAGPAIIDITADIQQHGLIPESTSHHHPAHDEHHAQGEDPHIWLSPPLLVPMAENIHQALVAADPKHKQTYDINLTKLIAAIDSLHGNIKQQLAPFKGNTFYVFHPAFGYFASTYGLRQKAVETGGKSPSPRQLAKLIRQAKADGVKIIFTQPQFDKSSAAAIARAIDGTVVTMDPLAQDILANLKKMAQAIEQAMYHE